MQRRIAYQDALLPDLAAEFPSTRYQGSKAKLVDWIWAQIADLDFLTCLDAFGGEGEGEGSKHRRLRAQRSEWTDKKSVHSAFDRLFQRYQKSILVVSYRSDGIPSEAELVSILGRYKANVRVEHFGQYKYVLSTNAESKEILLIGT